jgi:hypothetical protein
MPYMQIVLYSQRSEVVREEVDIILDSSYSVSRPNKNANVSKFKREVETAPVSDKTVESRFEKVEQDRIFDH